MADEQIQYLIDTGAFERHWYMAQCDIYFHSTWAAAAHFISNGMAKDASPNPLLLPSMWPEHLRRSWRKGDVVSVFRYFQRPKTEIPALGPLFDPRFMEIPDAAYRSHMGGLVGYFIQNSSEGTMLPTRYGDLEIDSVLKSWPSIYSDIKFHNRLTSSRISSSWDSEREFEWMAEIDGRESVLPPPKVSVVVPVWNRSDELARAVRSVQSQTYEHWELVVVDDGSSDSSGSVARALADADPRIMVLSIDHGGVSAARNAGLDAATGEYVAFLDSDNVWVDYYLEYMIKGLSSAGGYAAYSALELQRDGRSTFRSFEGGSDHLLVVNHIDLNVLVVKRELALKVRFDTDIRRWVDHDFVVRLSAYCNIELFPFIGCIYDDRRDSSDRITTTESDAWQWVVLGKNLVDWSPLVSERGVVGRVSVVIPTYQDWAMTLKAAIKVLANSEGFDVEVILIDNGSAPYVGAVLRQFFSNDSRVVYRRLPRNMNFAIGCNVGASLSTGEYICFLNNDTEVRPDWLGPLVSRIEVEDVIGVQPLLQFPDDSIQSAGSVFLAPRTIPCHFLVGHPPEDAINVGIQRFNAVSAACLMMQRTEFSQLNGFDPIYVNGLEDVDLCLRAVESTGGYFVVEPLSRVTHHESKTPGRGRAIPENRQRFMDRWRDSLVFDDTAKYTAQGFSLASVGGDGLWFGQPKPSVVRITHDLPMRWGIRYASIGGERGDRWGDTYYVKSLADALGVEGQSVVTYRHGANTESSFSFDDVNLVIRGIDPIPPIPGQLNILWIISHPEDVTASELQAFDLVFASSAKWAQDVSARYGVKVQPLYQATDSNIFHLPNAQHQRITRPLTFVGAHFPNRTRRAVSDALVSGVDFRVIGHGWKNLPREIHESEGIANSDLGELYRMSNRVLADHWPDMASEGFIQNRIFDAVACGTPVITDSVEGLSDIFGSLVQVYEDSDHLRYLASPEAESVFGSIEERTAQANSVLHEHSFSSRAKFLIEQAEAKRSELFVS